MNQIKATFDYLRGGDHNAKLSDFKLPLINEYFNDHNTKGFPTKKNEKYKPTILKFFPSDGKNPDHKNHGY